jgi:hypothetical protein
MVKIPACNRRQMGCPPPSPWGNRLESRVYLAHLLAHIILRAMIQGTEKWGTPWLRRYLQRGEAEEQESLQLAPCSPAVISVTFPVPRLMFIA